MVAWKCPVQAHRYGTMPDYDNFELQTESLSRDKRLDLDEIVETAERFSLFRATGKC